MLEASVELAAAAAYVAQAEQVMDLLTVGEIQSGCILLSDLLSRSQGRDKDIHDIMTLVQEKKCKSVNSLLLK